MLFVKLLLFLIELVFVVGVSLVKLCHNRRKLGHHFCVFLHGKTLPEIQRQSNDFEYYGKKHHGPAVIPHRVEQPFDQPADKRGIFDFRHDTRKSFGKSPLSDGFGSGCQAVHKLHLMSPLRLKGTGSKPPRVKPHLNTRFAVSQPPLKKP